MGIRVDLEARTITAGVRDLAAQPGPSASLSGPLFQLRAALGRDAHRLYRSARFAEPGFAAEVAVELQHQVDGFEVRLRGRIDGLIDRGDPDHGDSGAVEPGDDVLTVEEVKSVSEPLESLALEDLLDAARQVQLYALALHQHRSGPGRIDRSIAARLVLIPIVESAVGSSPEDFVHRVLEVPFDPAAVRGELDRRLRVVIERAEAVRQRGRSRAAVARKLRFPYDAPRAPQVTVMDAVAEGLVSGRPVLVQAPTGTGKTVGALLPALRFAMERDRPVYFATAKTTQRALAARTFRDIAEASAIDDRELTAVTLRAKEQMCPPGHLVCHPDHCGYLVDFADRAEQSDAMARLGGSRLHVEPDDAYRLGESLRLCPFELLLGAAADAELVVCDYNHVYDGRSAVLAGAVPGEDGADTGAAVVIVDEAHNLFDRARGYQSCSLGRDELARVREILLGERTSRTRSSSSLAASTLWTTADQLTRTAGSLWPDAVGVALRDDLVALCDELAAWIDEAAEAALGPLHVDELVEGCTPACDCCGSRPEPWNQLAGQAARLALRYVLYRRHHGRLDPRDPVLDALDTVGRIRDSVAARRPSVVPYVATRHAPDGAGFGVLCLDPAEYLAHRHERVAGTVAMSATLEPLGYFSDALGFGAERWDPLTVAVPSPFLAENRFVLVVRDIDTRYRERARHHRAIARHIATIAGARPGRYVAFFPSFAFLARVREQLALPSDRVLVQLPGMPQRLRDTLLERFRASPGSMLLCAVLGGAFAEGIDLPGEQLIGAIIVGPGLPAVGFERVLMQQYYDERVGAGFEYAMLYPGMQRVVQAAGRVIRTATDRGVIALLGRRFAESRYAGCLPADWRLDGGSALVPGGDVHEPVSDATDGLERALAGFWSS